MARRIRGRASKPRRTNDVDRPLSDVPSTGPVTDLRDDRYKESEPRRRSTRGRRCESCRAVRSDRDRPRTENALAYLYWQIAITNTSAQSIEFGDVGLPLPFNEYWFAPNDVIYETRTVYHSFTGKRDSYITVGRPSGVGPFLLMVPTRPRARASGTWTTGWAPSTPGAHGPRAATTPRGRADSTSFASTRATNSSIATQF